MARRRRRPASWAQSVVGKRSSAGRSVRKARVGRTLYWGNSWARRAKSGDATRPRPGCRCPAHGPAAHLQEVVRQRQAHVGARAHASIEVAFGREPLERAHDGAAAEAVLTGQVPAGRQTGAGAQAPRQDFVSEGLTQPGGRGLARGPGRQRQREGGALLGHNGTVKILKMALCASTLERYCGVPKEEP